MEKHFHRELVKLKKRILTLGGMVEERVRMAINAIDTRNDVLAETIVKKDFEIDEIEVEIEEECLKILALHQPVAVDLRFITAVVKINNDLERIADEAVNIARCIRFLSKEKIQEFRFDFVLMAEKAEDMLKKSLDALVNLDQDLALKVCFLDDKVDAINADIHRMVKEIIPKELDHTEHFINLLLISRHIERIADHATNIAEEVIYLIEGEIVRHGIG